MLTWKRGSREVVGFSSEIGASTPLLGLLVLPGGACGGGEGQQRPRRVLVAGPQAAGLCVCTRTRIFQSIYLLREGWLLKRSNTTGASTHLGTGNPDCSPLTPLWPSSAAS